MSIVTRSCCRIITTSTCVETTIVRQQRPLQMLFCSTKNNNNKKKSSSLKTKKEQYQRLIVHKNKDTDSSPKGRRNEQLEAIKWEGMEALENSTKDMIRKVGNQRLLNKDEDNEGPSVRQLREAERLFRLCQQVIHEDSSSPMSSLASLRIQGQSIVIIDVEVSRDLKQARIYWSLPYSILLRKDIPDSTLTQMQGRMQQLLQLPKYGGRIQTLVHTKLRFYYPPKFTFVPAEQDLIRQDLLESLI